MIHRRNPGCKIVCVEACPENIPALVANVGHFATIVQGAMTYEPGELALLNAVRPGCESTGGSVVVARSQLNDPSHPLRQHGYQYWDDLRPLRKVSLREAMDAGGLDAVSCLKLDCEGAELSILDHADLTPVQYVFGEWHDTGRWNALREKRFADWDYGIMFESGGRGLFHLVNPDFKIDKRSRILDRLKGLVPIKPFTQSDAEEQIRHLTQTDPAMYDPGRERTLCTLFGAIRLAYPELNDLILEMCWMARRINDALQRHKIRVDDVPDQDAEMHARLAAVAEAACRGIPEPKIVETGTRAGYSALTFFDSVPNASVVGYDAYCDADSPVMRTAAEKHLAGKNFELVERDTNSVMEYPECDLFFIDGDHSFSGCTNDLNRAAAAADVIAVDDFYPDDKNHAVTRAVRWFALNTAKEFILTQISVANGRCLAVFSTPARSRTEFGLPWGGCLKVACVPGIGDTAWVIAKIPAILEKLGASGVEIATCENGRALQYLESLPFVRRASVTPYHALEIDRPVTGTGAYNYAPSQPGWHDEFDFFLQVNGHLEDGHRLEAWFPNLKIDWLAPGSFTEDIEDQEFAREFRETGKYITIFCAGVRGNSSEGHNVGGAWTPEDWRTVAVACHNAGYRVILLGRGDEDRGYADSIRPLIGHLVEDTINRWELPRTLSVLMRSSGHIGYQSGLGILSTYLGIPAAMFWQKKGVPLNSLGATFSEDMATAWVPPHVLSSGEYLGAIYGRTTAKEVADWIVSHAKEVIPFNPS